MLRLTAIVLALLMFGPHATAGDWELLGARHAGFESDKDTLPLARVAKFKRFKLYARKNGVEVKQIKLLFTDGSSEEVKVGQTVLEGRWSSIFISKGKGIVRAVEFDYNSTPNFMGPYPKGEAQVELWGKED